MKPCTFVARIAFVLALTPLAWSAELELDYRLKIDKPETGVGYVTLTINGLDTKGFELARAKAAGETWFDGVKAVDGARNSLTVVPVDKGFYVTTQGDAKAVVTYTIKPGQVRGEGHIGLVCADYAALDASMIFLLPPADIKLKNVLFSVEVPAGWQAVMSWPGTQGYYRPDATLAPMRDQLEKSLLCFGDFRKTSKKFGLNDVTVWNLSSYPGAEAEKLAKALFTIYGRLYEILKCDTGVPYNIVCLPPAPDELPVVAGAWADGQALTLAGTFVFDKSMRYAQYFARFIIDGYFVGSPLGVDLADEDKWVYSALRRYAEGLAGQVNGGMDENVFYAAAYTLYAAEAQSDTPALDLPMAKLVKAEGAAREFLEETKAPVLLMRLDFEIRAATMDKANVETFLMELYGAGRNWEKGVSIWEVLKEVTGADFVDFKNRFVKERDVILPTWPSFIDRLAAGKDTDPGPVVAEVDTAKIYQREVDILVDALYQQGTVGNRNELARTALAALINEKLTDKELAGYRINVIPEPFWRLRLALPAPVMSVVISAKRQALKDLLYDDWQRRARTTTKVDIIEPKPAPPAATTPATSPLELLPPMPMPPMPNPTGGN